MKKRSLIFLILLLLIFMTSCVKKQDYGIIKNFYIDNYILKWDDVEDAIYYEVHNFGEDENSKNVLGYTFSSEYNQLINFNLDVNYSITIKVFYEELDPVFSEPITFVFETEYPRPTSVGYNYVNDGTFLWKEVSATKDNPVLSYTVLVDDQEYEVLTNEFSVAEMDLGIHRIQLKANYEGASSVYTPVNYYYRDLPLEIIQVDFDTSLDSDLSIPFEHTDDIVVILDHQRLYVKRTEGEAGIFTITEDSIIVNKHYLNMFIKEFDYMYILSRITVVTSENQYLYYINYQEN